jgi:hypothetical protein
MVISTVIRELNIVGERGIHRDTNASKMTTWSVLSKALSKSGKVV